MTVDLDLDREEGCYGQKGPVPGYPSNGKKLWVLWPKSGLCLTKDFNPVSFITKQIVEEELWLK